MDRGQSGMQQGSYQSGQSSQSQSQSQSCKHTSQHKMLDVDDAVLVLIDHQTGLFNMVRDIDVDDLQTNVLSLARAAYLSKIPVIVTTAKQDSFNGPLIGDLDKIIPDAYLVKREEEINPWENKEFCKTIEKIGKKTLIISGTLTNVCVALAAIAASFDGYKVYVVADSCGASSKAACKLAAARMSFAHCILTDTLAMVYELMQTFSRKDCEQWLHVFGAVAPRFRLMVDNYRNAEQGHQAIQGYGRNIEDKFQPSSRGERSDRDQEKQQWSSSGWKGQEKDESQGRYGQGEYKETRLSDNRKYVK